MRSERAVTRRDEHPLWTSFALGSLAIDERLRMTERAFHDQDFNPPKGVRTDEFMLRPLVVSDNQLDYEAVMETREFLRKWSQAPWPEDDFTAEGNREDMVAAQEWFADRYAYLYTVMNPLETECLGCIYIFTPDANWLHALEKVPVSDAQWSDFGAVVSFWVRASRAVDGLEGRLFDAIRKWFDDEWPFESCLFHTNEGLVQQVEVLETAGLRLMFRLSDPAEPADSICYAQLGR